MNNAFPVGKILALAAVVAGFAVVAGLYSTRPSPSRAANVLLALTSATPTPTPTLMPPPPPTTSMPIGHLDGVNDLFAYGWACDPDNYSAAVSVQVYASTATILNPGTTANLRTDATVAAKCGGTSNHGFKFYWPEGVADGKSHGIIAMATDLYPPVGTNPQTVQLGPQLTLVMASIPSTTVAYPNGGEVLKRGSTYAIKWNVKWDEEWAFGLPRTLSTPIYLADANGIAAPILIGSNVNSKMGANKFSWTIPSTVPAGNHYIISLSFTAWPNGATASDVSNGPFSVQ